MFCLKKLKQKCPAVMMYCRCIQGRDSGACWTLCRSRTRKVRWCCFQRHTKTSQSSVDWQRQPMTITVSTEACLLLFLLRKISREFCKLKTTFSQFLVEASLPRHRVNSNIRKQTRGMSFTLISARINNKIQLQYHSYHINTEFVQKYKKFPSPLKPRCGRSQQTVDIKIFARQFYELLTCYRRIYANLVEKSRHASDIHITYTFEAFEPFER